MGRQKKPTMERTIKTLHVPGFRVSESRYDAASVVPTQPHSWGGLCLALEGGYQIDLGRTRLSCNPASLMFQAPGEVYGTRISDAGSHCLTVAIDPFVLERSVGILDFDRLNATRRMPPHWLAYELHQELELGDELSSTSVASTVAALLAELGDRPGLEARSAPPPWLARVQEQIHDEFRRHHTLESLALAAGVHHVHLAREFRRRFGCTVGHYIRQRRVTRSQKECLSLRPLSDTQKTSRSIRSQ
jgi:AraC family transcriptional regulator